LFLFKIDGIDEVFLAIFKIVGGLLVKMYKSNLSNNEQQAIWEKLLTKRHLNNQNKLLQSVAREISFQFNVALKIIRAIFKQG